MINQIEHNEVKSSQISENEVVGSKDSSGTIINDIHLLKLCYAIGALRHGATPNTAVEAAYSVA